MNMKKLVALLLVACCIAGMLAMSISAAGPEDAVVARYDPLKKVCIRAANFRQEPNTSSRIIGVFMPGDIMALLDPNYDRWMYGLAAPGSAIHELFPDVEGYAAAENFGPYSPW